MKRRNFIKSGAVIAAGGLAGCSSDEEISDKERFLVDSLRGDGNINFEDEEGVDLYVGDPNNYDYSGSEVTASGSAISQRISDGTSAEGIFREVYKHNGGKERVLDAEFTDPLEYDIIGNGEVDVILYDNTEAEYTPTECRNALDWTEEVMGIDISLDVKQTERYNEDQMIELAKTVPDKLLLHAYDGQGDPKATKYSNLGMIDLRRLLDSEDPESAVMNAFRHEGLHAFANLPHIPRTYNNLMSVGTRNPELSRPSRQAEEMARIYANSDISYSIEREGGKNVAVASVEPNETIDNGSRMAENSMRGVLSLLGENPDDWSVEMRDSFFHITKEDTHIVAEPDPKAGFDRVGVVDN